MLLVNTYQLVPLARLDIERVRTTLQQPLTVKHVAKAGVGTAARLLPTLALISLWRLAVAYAASSGPR